MAAPAWPDEMLVALNGPRCTTPADGSAPKTSFCEREIGSVETYNDSGRLLAGGGGGGLLPRTVTVLARPRSPGLAVYSLDRISSLLLPSLSSLTSASSVMSLLGDAEEPVKRDDTVSPRLKRGSIPLKLDRELSDRFLESRGAAKSSLDGLYRGP